MPRIIINTKRKVAEIWRQLTLIVKRKVRESNLKPRRCSWYCPNPVDAKANKCPKYDERFK